MLYDDHRPAHFHADYGEYRILVEVESGVIEGRFPRRALAALMEWYILHKDELRENWVLAAEHCALKKIAPLE